MATDVQDNLEESEELPEGHTGPYSIAGKAGPDLAEQVRLADWHCQRIAELEVTEAILAGPIVEEIERLEARLDAVRAPLQAKRRWHEAQVQWWVLEENIRERVGKSVPLAHGQIKTRQTPGKTEVQTDRILCLYRDHPQEFGDLIKPTVDSKAVRERYALQADGTCVDTVTGEVLSEPVIVVTEEPSVKVIVTALGPGRDVAAEE